MICSRFSSLFLSVFMAVSASAGMLDSGWKFAAGSDADSLEGEDVLRVVHNSYHSPGAWLDDVGLIPGKTYKLSFQVRCKTLSSGANAYYQRIVPMNVVNDEEKIYSISKFIGSEKFITDELIFTVPKDSERSKWQIQLFSRVTGRGLYYKNVRLEEIERPPHYELVVTSPAFRHNIYKSKPVENITGFVEAEPQPARLIIELRKGDVILQSTSGKEFCFSGVDQFADGQYTLKADLFDENNNKIKTLEQTIGILPRAPTEVIIGQDNNCYVNGELFVPLFFGRGADNKEMRDFAVSHGVNLFIFRPENSQELEMLLDEARIGGWKVICATPYFGSNPPDKEPESVRKWLNHLSVTITPELRLRPELFGYILNDEPAVKGEPLAPLLEAYRQLREFDPYRPVWINEAPHGSVELNRQYSQAADIYGMDVYPVGRWAHGRIGDFRSLTTVGACVALCREAVGGRKPIWMYLQAYAWKKDWSTPSQAIYPDFTQSRFMFYDSLLNGATGFGYYGSYSLCRESFVPVLFKTTSEIHAISGLARGKEVNSGFDGEVRWKKFKCGDVDVVIAANYSQEPQKATIKAELRDGSYKVYFEERKINTVEGTLNDHFNGYEVHVYANGILQPLTQLNAYNDSNNPWIDFIERTRAKKLAEENIKLKWIWAQGQEKTVNSKVWLARQVVIRKPLAKASLTVTADNMAIVYVNQQKIGITRSWNHPVTMDLTANLHVGENFLTAHAWDIGGLPCGFIAMLRLDFKDGSKQIIYSDRNWRAIKADNDTPPCGDDVKAFWPEALELVPYSKGRWGDKAKFPLNELYSPLENPVP